MTYSWKSQASSYGIKGGMNMLHLLKYRFRLMLRNKVLLFWTLLFPMLLTTFFGMVLKDAYTVDTFQTVPIAVVEQGNLRDVKSVLKEVKQKDTPLFDVSYTTEKQAKQLLKDNKVSAVVSMQDPIQITINQNGLNQTITKTFFDEYAQKTSLVEEAMKLHPDGSALKTLFPQTASHVEDAEVDHTDISAVFFYTVLAMNAMFGGYWAINSMYELQANQSERAARVSVSPMHKGKALLADFLIDIGMQLLFLMIQFSYMYFILDVSFGAQLGYVFLMMVMGAFAGNAFGILLGSISSKIPPDGKTGIMTAVTLICSALAGMMMVQMKYYVQEYAPILAYINPVNMITDGLYSLYYYGIGERYYLNLALLAAFTIICYLISFRALSRKSYDSLGVR